MQQEAKVVHRHERFLASRIHAQTGSQYFAIVALRLFELAKIFASPCEVGERS